MKIFLTIAFINIFTTMISAQENTNLIDALSNNQIIHIEFDNEVYNLAWSHSNNSHYKQEYIREQDKLGHFNKMITIDVWITDFTIKDILSKKIIEIQTIKESNPVANYQVIENEKTGEFLLDFLISKGDLYEWNAYRYKTINTIKGNTVILFAYSLRSFEDAELRLDNFFTYLKKNRMDLINKVANYKLPELFTPN